jgi:hypothetical protein
MCYPEEWYQMNEMIGHYFLNLRPAQQRGLALWVYGAILARSACQNAVVAALICLGKWDGLRQHLREWLYDGQDKAAPCQTEVDVAACFGPLLCWMLSLWQGQKIALAVDVTNDKDRLTCLAVSLLYRGTAIPLAWHILPANQKGPWMGHILCLLRLLGRHMPKNMRVLVMVDRGLRSRRLWKRIKDLGWHPLLRLQYNTRFQPLGGCWQSAAKLVTGPGQAWVGEGTAFSDKASRRQGTLIVVWGPEEKEPWVLFTDIAPSEVGVWWYSLRVWIELGFRVIKAMGWRWEHTRRMKPTRVARHWLVMAVATMWVLACGTRAEDAEWLGRAAIDLELPQDLPMPNTGTVKRKLSVFQRGMSWIFHQFKERCLWSKFWLSPEAWPIAPPGLQVTYHVIT